MTVRWWFLWWCIEAGAFDAMNSLPISKHGPCGQQAGILAAVCQYCASTSCVCVVNSL